MTIVVGSVGIGNSVDSVGMDGIVANDHDGAGDLSSNGGRRRRKRDLRIGGGCLSVLKPQQSVSYSLQLLLLDVQVKLGCKQEHKFQLIQLGQTEATNLQQRWVHR